MRTAIVILLVFIISTNCYSYERTEAQRYYDLGVSYIKSDLYEKGLDTLNQVAFLYPDSDVADDALYQLALIREQVGDGKIVVGNIRRLEAEREVLDRLTGSNTQLEQLADILTIINAQLAGKQVLNAAKERAIVQYILALDYLNTISQRYPNSDRSKESALTFKRIVAKIDALVPKPEPPKPPIPLYRKILNTISIFAVVVFIVAITK